MNARTRICVFCGSSMGRDPLYREAAETLGRLMGERGIRLVYGGSNVGLMGVLADAALAAGGEVIGVIPHHLEAREIAHLGLTELRIVSSMHERKTVMADLSDAFIALPGVLGTLEELFEIVTWAQLGLHRKPVGLLNVGGYFDLLHQFLKHAETEHFVSPEFWSYFTLAAEPQNLLDGIATAEPPVFDRWLDRSTT